MTIGGADTDSNHKAMPCFAPLKPCYALTTSPEMTDFTALLQQGSASGWLFIPSAILLGALHGLEPGHSKSMMAAFVVAIRGTAAQAALLGLSATVSHTAVVWIIAVAGLYFGQRWNAATSEPILQIASAVVMILMALWMARNIWRTGKEHSHHHGDEHHHDDDDHAAAHAREIAQHFAGKQTSTSQIILFGLTGGLIPCPASITVLLLCLQLKQFTLGLTLVLCFSIGLALTLVLSGVIAAISLRHLTNRWKGLSRLMHDAPYVSCLLILIVACVVGYHGIRSLHI